MVLNKITMLKINFKAFTEKLHLYIATFLQYNQVEQFISVKIQI